LRHRDPDEAVRTTLEDIVDWGGGTRLGSCLAAFNAQWARRLLGSRTTVLLLTDGLDREDTALLAREAARLRRHARRVIWLNPLLRFEGFEARAAGVKALLPAVDAMLPVHNLKSLERLPRALALQSIHQSGHDQPFFSG
ncbi:MAG: VWA domain-containing protein, partial [Betaproteobacteria bacterium]